MNGSQKITLTISQLRKLLTETVQDIELYHLSQENHDGETFTPKIPTYDDPEWNDKGEDSRTPRVSFSKSIKGALKGVPMRHIRRVWDVHVPVDMDPSAIYEPTEDEVYDVGRSKEVWYLKPVKLKFKERIFVRDIHTGDFEVMNPLYEPPYSLRDAIKHLGYRMFRTAFGELKGLRPAANSTPGQKAHVWRALTGIELIHREPSKEELVRIVDNWNLMTNEQKKISDEKSLELFGVTNEENAKQLLKDIV